MGNNLKNGKTAETEFFCDMNLKNGKTAETEFFCDMNLKR